MPKITLKLVYLKFDDASFKKNTDKTIKAEMRMAARAWLRAVIPSVPVFTGTARGSLQPLGRFLKVAVPITPVATRTGMGPSVGAGQQSFEFTSENGKYWFRFDSTVVHYMINEFYSVPLPLKHPTPWHSFEKGRQAFNDYVKNVLPGRLPRLSQYVKARSLIRKP